MSGRARGLLRLAALVALVAGAGVVVALIAGSNGGRGGKSRIVSRTAPSAPARPPKLILRTSPHRLPEAISGEAAVAGPGGGVLSIGGLDSSTVSTTGVVELRPSSGIARSYGSLAQPLHDAAAAVVDGRTLAFGGGAATTIASVESLTPAGKGSIIGQLPQARSDLSAVSVGSRAYVLGGYDGTAPVADVLETKDGRTFNRIASLPVPVRYAAVALRAHVIYAFGGELASGRDSDAIQAIDVGTEHARLLGHLPRARSHASAVALGGRIYVLGGRSGGVPSDGIVAFNPTSGRAETTAAKLPHAVTNAAAAVAHDTGFLIGGLGANGTALDSVITIRLVAG
jgi:hypothetical protein